ncbi:MAG: TolC family protein [bacterium]|nr:TolC family protein [bacterium]
MSRSSLDHRRATPVALRLGLAALLAAATACGHVRPEAAFPGVRDAVVARLDQRVHWRRGTAEDAAVDAAVDDLLAQPLDVDAAVQVALLRNPSLQATYEDLGVAQADLVQAGLLRNPVLTGAFRFPDRSPSGTNIEMDLAQEFVNLVFLPARTRIAAAQVVEVQHRVAAEVLDLAAEVRAAYWDLVAAHNTVAVLRTVAEVADVSRALTERLHEAGNVSELQLASETALATELELEVARAEAEIAPARERLGRLLGVGAGGGWSVPAQLPAVPEAEPDLPALEEAAYTQRPDLLAVQQEVAVLRDALGLQQVTRWFPIADVGVAVEHEREGTWLVGPSLSLVLPIFDQGNAERGRLESQLRQSEARLAARGLDVRAEVGAARARVASARAIAGRYRTALLPLRARVVALSIEHYNYMLLGPLALLQAKQAEVEALRGYIEAVRDFWLARTALERALAARLPVAVAAAPATDGAPAADAHRHHHHGGH